MKKIFSTLAISLFVFFIYSCNNASPEEYNSSASDPLLLHENSQQLTKVIIADIFKPPVASRIYAYSFMAAYEALQPQSEDYASLAGKLNGFKAVPQPQEDKAYCLPLASMKAFVTVGKALTFNTGMWETYEKDFYAHYQKMGIPADVYQRSEEYGLQVADHILAYAAEDNYKTTRGIRHTVKHTPGSWEPTPPTYAEACEPEWGKIRSFTLDSVNQFSPAPPAPFDMSEDSKFYALTKEVYEIDRNMTDEQREIAYFWDDNPFVTNLVGHATFTEKKMTPPGHWVEIVRTVAEDKKLDMLKALEAYTLSSIALFDGFIASWDAKYKTDRVRPVTVINNSFDQDWMPFLETPSFPEYVSAHSAISASAGRVLTHLLGDNVAFTDSTEHKYGHGVRSFKSFEEAYWETSMSRVYGGIHYRDGVEQGTYQGERIGNWVWEKTRNTASGISLNTVQEKEEN